VEQEGKAFMETMTQTRNQLKQIVKNARDRLQTVERSPTFEAGVITVIFVVGVCGCVFASCYNRGESKSKNGKNHTKDITKRSGNKERVAGNGHRSGDSQAASSHEKPGESTSQRHQPQEKKKTSWDNCNAARQ